MIELKLLKDGTLTHTDWVYDNTIGEGKFVTSNIQDTQYKTLLSVLDKPVEIEDGVTLGSLLELLSSVDIDSQTYNNIFNNCWIREYADKYQTVKDAATPYDITDRDAIEYIHVFRTFYVDTVNKSSDYVISHGSITGMGIEQPEDYVQRGCVHYEKGSRIHWNISQSDLTKIINLPIVVSNQVEFYEDNDDILSVLYARKIPLTPLLSFTSPYTLRDIIRDIFWELSWGGGPN